MAQIEEDPPQEQVAVAIVGGGIAGLSTAWYLQQQGLDYLLLEQSERWGGKILTERVEDVSPEPFIIEGGPDSFLTQKPWALQLARELGLEDQLLGTNDHLRQTYVLNKGRPTPLPDGVLLIVPTKIMPFVKSPLISPLGKLRMGLDLLIPAQQGTEDETVADFITRRLGREALDKIAEPLMSGIYNAEAERQSLLATFPRFRTLEQEHGGLIKGMLASLKARRNGRSAPNNQPKMSMFVTLKEGTEDLVDALIEQLQGEMYLEAGVTDLMQTGTGYRLTLTDGRQIQAQAVVLAVPAYVAARLVEGIAPAAAEKLNQIRYVSTGTISLGFRQQDVNVPSPSPLDGFGLVIPRNENRQINAVTVTSTKFDQRAPDDHLLLRVFFGGSRSPEMMDKPDEEIVSIVRAELDALLGVKAQPQFHRIYRWPRANPQYDLGHLERVEAIEAALPPGLAVTGSPYRGIGLPDCVHQGKQTANTLGEQLTNKSKEGVTP